jgi:hypothetical protein
METFDSHAVPQMFDLRAHFDPIGVNFIKSDAGGSSSPFLVGRVLATPANIAHPTIDPVCLVALSL